MNIIKYILKEEDAYEDLYKGGIILVYQATRHDTADDSNLQ
jgi:hypothetical protein